jgi:predicted nucleic acid-binding protein
MPGGGGFLIGLSDINVLLALVWSHHAHHDAAHGWFARDAAAGWATCLLTQTGFLRLSLNPQIVGVALDGQAALHLLQSVPKVHDVIIAEDSMIFSTQRVC